MPGPDAMRFSARRAHWENQPVVRLADRVNGVALTVAQHGAAVLAIEVQRDGGTENLADGYRDAREIVERPGSRFAIMVPFAGRIADARYSFAGQPEDLQPGVSGSERASRHGFVRGADFAIETLLDGDAAAQVALSTTVLPQPGYPHTIGLDVTFTLDAGGITLDAGMRNAGERDAPCFFGWHPYFRLGDGAVDDWELQIPAQTLIRTDGDLIALPGGAAYVALDDAPALDFREPRRVGDSILDQGYTDLAADPDGRIRTHLRNPATGVAIAVWQEHGVMHAFTADTVKRDARRAVALEPMECMANAFNRSDCAATIMLAPGVTRHFRCGVEIDLP